MSGGFSFIHAADLHLDSPFRGLEQIRQIEGPVKENVLSRLRNCTFVALENIVEACISNRVDFLVLAGDIYDLADRSIRAELRFRKAVERLAEHNIEVFVAYGNHDFDEGGRSRLSWPENVHFFSPGEVEYREVALRGKQIARVYGISYPQRDVVENYALRFERHRDAPFAIGVLHCNVGGIPEHENYAPCRVEDLLRAGMDYWALGHVHSRRVLQEGAPCIVYPGTPQGRNPREAGEKGCYLVRVTDNGLASLQFLPVDDVRWTETRVSIEGMKTEDDLLTSLDKKLTEIQAVHGHRTVVTRIKLTGRGPLHRMLKSSSTADDILGELRVRFAGEEGDFVWPESMKCSTGIPVDKDSIQKGETLLGDLLSLGKEAGVNGELRERLRQSLAPLDERVAGYLSPLGEQELDELLGAAGDLAIDLLWGDD